MAQLNLYYPTQLETSVSLLPEQLDGNIDKHILTNLKAKSEGKSTENGIEIRINKIIEYKHGMIDKANLMGTTVYKVKYECFLCSPVKDMEIICSIQNIVRGFLICKNGPVTIAIETNYNGIDTQNFDIKNDEVYYKKGKESKLLEKDDIVKTVVINVKSNLNDKTIVAICKLIDMADKNAVKKYHNDQKMIINGKSDEEDDEFI